MSGRECDESVNLPDRSAGMGVVKAIIGAALVKIITNYFNLPFGRAGESMEPA